MARNSSASSITTTAPPSTSSSSSVSSSSSSNLLRSRSSSSTKPFRPILFLRKNSVPGRLAALVFCFLFSLSSPPSPLALFLSRRCASRRAVAISTDTPTRLAAASISLLRCFVFVANRFALAPPPFSTSKAISCPMAFFKKVRSLPSSVLVAPPRYRRTPVAVVATPCCASFFALIPAVLPVPARRFDPIPSALFSDGRLDVSGPFPLLLTFCNKSYIPALSCWFPIIFVDS
mmetsp:Transcript_7622/g.10382  ORF Transcript_7622/g.10382 Transcript_7622/m.10382 type:complete len:233 (-) Transcript_7622:726-1424(-)